MQDKEIEDYIQVQRSLGVKDTDIKDSLLSAGYDESDFHTTLTKPRKNTATKSNKTINTQHLLYINIAIILVFGSLFVYFTYDYNSKINTLSVEQEIMLNNVDDRLTIKEQEINTRMDLKEAELDNDINIIYSRTENINKDLKSNIQTTHAQAVSRDKALSDSIQKISNHSLTELSIFEQQLEIFKETAIDFTPIIPKAIKSVVTIGKKGPGYFTTAGSGVFINNNGYIITNYHVIDDLNDITIRTNNGEEYDTTIIGKDEEWDIAVIKVITEKDNFDYLLFGSETDIFVGKHVIAVGNPVGFESTVTEGIISNTNRLINGNDIHYIQTDVAINSGNSGGPLIDKNGNIVGIATLKYSKVGFEGLSFALRIDDVKRIVHNILEK